MYSLLNQSHQSWQTMMNQIHRWPLALLLVGQDVVEQGEGEVSLLALVVELVRAIRAHVVMDLYLSEEHEVQRKDRYRMHLFLQPRNRMKLFFQHFIKFKEFFESYTRS